MGFSLPQALGYFSVVQLAALRAGENRQSGRTALAQWKCQELSNAAWAFATLLAYGTPLVAAIADSAMGQLEKPSPRHSWGPPAECLRSRYACGKA